MITLKSHNYSIVHARLLIQDLYRKVYKSNTPAAFMTVLTENVRLGKYDSELLEKYSKEDIELLESKIDYTRDFNFKSIGIEQLTKKYLVKDRVKNIIFETPQVMFMTLAMAGFINEKKDRLKHILTLYDGLSLFKISLPTPIMANLRTPLKNFSSCALVRRGDSANSWLATDYAVSKLGLADNGIGLAEVDGRSIGSSVGDGKMKHHGFRPVAKVDEALISRSKQGNRNGASTNYFTWWNREIMDILTLKSPRTEESKRIMSLDYSILFNKFFYKAVQEDTEVALFSTKEAPELLGAMVSDNQELFEQVYTKYTLDETIPKKYIKAREIFKEFISQRHETGRYYVTNIDEVNRNSPFTVPIYQSNLCVTGDTQINIRIPAIKEAMKIDIKDLQIYLSKYNSVEVMSWDADKKEHSYEVIEAFAKTGTNKKLVQVTAENGNSVKCTPDHKVWTENRGYVEARNLTLDDVLNLSVARDSLKMLKLENLTETADVYDITVRNTHNFYANNILVHNCAEVLLPTTPLQYPNDTYEINGADVGICVLGNLVLSNIKQDEYELYGSNLNRLLDNSIDLINYSLPAAKSSTLNRRSLGIGISNLAHFFAENNVKYGSPEALRLLDKTMSRITYTLLKSSMQLAKEKGKAPLFNQTSYNKGILPLDRYNKNVDELVQTDGDSDIWDNLRRDIEQYGLRNSTLMSIPPAESSSQISNSTNGIEPIKMLLIRKDNGTDEAIQIAPEYPRLTHQYDMAFERKINIDYLKTVAILQKWVDNSISANTYFNPKLYEDEKVPVAELEESLLFSNYYGLKTLYYETVNSDSELDKEECEGCSV